MSKPSRPSDPQQPLSPQEAGPGAESSPGVDPALSGDSCDDAGKSDLLQELQAALEEKEANYDRFLRAQAELENYRRRIQKDREEERRFAPLDIIRELLPVLDNLQRAVEAVSQSGSVDDLREGVEMVLRQATDVLARFQVEPIEALGAPFDPNLHEALTQVATSEHPPLTVIQEVQRGYTLHDRVIRPSKVIVSAAPAETTTEES